MKMESNSIERIINENQELKEYLDLFKEKVIKLENENEMLKKCLEIILRDERLK